MYICSTCAKLLLSLQLASEQFWFALTAAWLLRDRCRVVKHTQMKYLWLHAPLHGILHNIVHFLFPRGQMGIVYNMHRYTLKHIVKYTVKLNVAWLNLDFYLDCSIHASVLMFQSKLNLYWKQLESVKASSLCRTWCISNSFYNNAADAHQTRRLRTDGCSFLVYRSVLKSVYFTLALLTKLWYLIPHHHSHGKHLNN